MVFLIALFLFMLMIINASISSRITIPIRELEKSVNALENGNLDVEVYQGGSYEIRHLGAFHRRHGAPDQGADAGHCGRA